MDEKRWAERLEADLAEGHLSLSKARIQQLPSDYRRMLALGLRLKMSNFSAESQSKEETLAAVFERIDRPRGSSRPFLLHWVGRLVATTAMIILAGIALLALPDILSVPSSHEPSAVEPGASTPLATSNSLSGVALRTLNLALERESQLTPPTYNPDERVPTRIMELKETELREIMALDAITESGLEPSTLVWVVRLSGDWLVDPPDPVPDGFYEFQRENHYHYIEVLLNAQTGEQVGGVVGYDLPEGIER